MQQCDLEGMLCFLVRERDGIREVALATKKDGKWFYENGYGGKRRSDQTIEECAVEEVRDESTVEVDVNDLQYHGYIDLYHNKELFGKGQGTSFRCHMYVVERWIGTPQETDEMSAPTWYPVTQLPFERMWPDKKYWIEQVLIKRRAVYGEIVQGEEQKVIAARLRFEDI